MTDPAAPSVFARLAALPFDERRHIEDELVLLGAKSALPGSTLDRVAEARLLVLVEEVEKRLAAQDPGTAPGSGGIRASTLPQDRSGAGGALPGHPRVSTTTSASPSVPWYPGGAPRSTATAMVNTDVPGLPADTDAALRKVVDHLRLAKRAKATDATLASLRAGYLAELWARPAVRSEFGRAEELVAFLDYLEHNGQR